MEEQDFPALYRSADKLSLDSQKHFFSNIEDSFSCTFYSGCFVGY